MKAFEKVPVDVCTASPYLNWFNEGVGEGRRVICGEEKEREDKEKKNEGMK